MKVVLLGVMGYTSIDFVSSRRLVDPPAREEGRFWQHYEKTEY